MENNSVPANNQSPAITTIKIQIGPEFQAQILSHASIASLGSSPTLPINGDTPLRICLLVGDLVRYILANQETLPLESSNASDAEAPQASVETRDASGEALDPSIPGPSTREPLTDTPIADDIIDALPTPNVRLRRVGFRGNRIYVAEDKAPAQIKSEIAMASHSSSTAASSSRLTEPSQVPTQNEGLPATLEAPATQEPSPENLAQAQELTEGSTENTQNPEVIRDALEDLTDFLNSNLSSIPIFWQKFVRSIIDLLSQVQSIVAHIMTMMTILKTGSSIIEYLEPEADFPGAGNGQMRLA
ncbi:hypothetical protein TWF679_008323 [Orbilia oligospora]|uniref:Uncharacterized protein n=1 Tax=Orbilia oligospora TaxID=2813651 RepID=A0A8H8V5E2_ORBOL|nr:hypothetical protein TWF679_008323 [Orbilia oligospora]